MTFGAATFRWAALVALALTAVTPASATPPPVEQISADCAAPSYASDQLVCSDTELRGVDRQMVAMLADAGQSAIEPESPLIESQSAWLKRRSLCAMQAGHRECLDAAYAERIAVLVALTEKTDQYGQSLKCGNRALSGVTASYYRRPDGIVFAISSKILVGVAMPPKSADWKPFLATSQKGSRISLRTLDGAQLNCRRSR